MAKPQQTPAFPPTYDSGDDHNDTAAASECSCFRGFCFRRDEDESHSSLLHENEGEGGSSPQPESWLVAKLKELRGLSELVAGPKWKNLIRKMGRICHTRKRSKTAVEFHYSPQSYALNFACPDHAEDGELLHSFSTRFAPGFSNIDQQRRPGL